MLGHDKYLLAEFLVTLQAHIQFFEHQHPHRLFTTLADI